MPVELEARAPEPPADVAGWFQEGEWGAMSEADRLITIRTARSTGEIKGAEAGGFEPTLETAQKPVPEPPAAPKFERTALGDQGLIPGAESREIPQTPLQETAAQKDVTETPLFGQERAAREAAQARAQGDLFAGPTPEQFVEQAGGVVRGRSTVQGQEMLWFSERGSDSTTVMPVAEVTPEAVAQRLGEIKARFAKPPGPPRLGEPPPPPRPPPPSSGGSGGGGPAPRPGEPPKGLPQFARESVRPPEPPPQVTPEQGRAGMDSAV